MTDTEGSNRGWVAVGLWLALQVTLTSLPGKAVPALPHSVHLAGHLCLYGGLGALVARVGAFRRWPMRRLVWAGVALSAWGALDELHQLFIPGRSCELIDWGCDTLGASLGLLLGAQVMRSRWARWLH